jgi:hypothetical protein
MLCESWFFQSKKKKYFELKTLFCPSSSRSGVMLCEKIENQKGGIAGMIQQLSSIDVRLPGAKAGKNRNA